MHRDSTTDPALSVSLKEQAIIVLLCVLAVVRIFIFAGAFPFFANVDEGLHFDLVVKYSRGHAPHGIETISPRTAHFLALYNSPEFLNTPAQGSSGHFPAPAWKQPPGSSPEDLPPPPAYWVNVKNFESGQMPLYYVLAGAWMRLGEFVGFDNDLGLLYWVRFFNVFIAAALVWISYCVARLVFPTQRLLRVAIPLLVAFLPQDTFYQIQNDVLSPLCFGLLFLSLLKLFYTETVTIRWALLTGFAFAATYLVKTSNLPLLGVAGIAILWRARQSVKTGNGWQNLLPWVLLACCALLPVLLWSAWCQFSFGDLTASAGKISLLGWTRRPFLDWFNHPIFTLHGAWTFWLELIASFWRGEFEWHKVRMALPGIDLFYCISSTVLIVGAMFNLRSRSLESSKQRSALWLSVGCCLALVCFYVVLSVMFDFGTNKYPSQAFPYFASGRLMSGALIPFFLLYVQGLNWFCSFTGRRWPLTLCLLTILFVMIVSEMVVTWPVFASEFNLYHF